MYGFITKIIYNNIMISIGINKTYTFSLCTFISFLRGDSDFISPTFRSDEPIELFRLIKVNCPSIIKPILISRFKFFLDFKDFIIMGLLPVQIETALFIFS